VKIIDNPFLTIGYKDQRSFCDREDELATLINNAENQNHTALFAMRRIGKTGLVKHFFHSLKKEKGCVCIYIDIYATTTLKEFTNLIATAINAEFPQKASKSLGKSFLDLIKSLRPTISFDPLNGNPEISIDLAKPKQYEQTLQQLFQFLDEQNLKIIIAIDEFQQILTYPETNTEAFLRTIIQQLKNTSFVFCGSNHKLMHELFNSAKRPFYSSCANLTLEYISIKKYQLFIEKQFKRFERRIEKEATEFILSWTMQHTYYTQFLCNRVFALDKVVISKEDVMQVCINILKEQESIYFQYRSLLTKNQWLLLEAIAKEEGIDQINSKYFITKYKLGLSSSMNRSLESLLTKELIYKELGTKKAAYMISDKFFMRWLQRLG